MFPRDNVIYIAYYLYLGPINTETFSLVPTDVVLFKKAYLSLPLLLS